MKRIMIPEKVVSEWMHGDWRVSMVRLNHDLKGTPRFSIVVLHGYVSTQIPIEFADEASARLAFETAKRETMISIAIHALGVEDDADSR